MERVLLMPRRMRNLAIVSLVALAIGACGSKKESAAPPTRARAIAEQPEWIPAENRTAKGKYRDTGVYVDGVPVGFLAHGDLPSGLAPVQVEGRMMREFGPGDHGPRTQPIHYTRYRLADYLEQVGVPLASVREVHLYGGPRIAGRLTGADLRRARDGITFSFGRGSRGKALLHLPPGIRLGTSFDHIAAIAVYVRLTPPRIRPSAEVEQDGAVVTDIPYFGEPLRGGIRVYKDDRLVTVIKRRLLTGEDRLASWKGDRLRWRLAAVLAELGVRLDDVAFAQLIFDEERGRRIPGAELKGAWFVADPARRGVVALGDAAEPMQGIALFTR